MKTSILLLSASLFFAQHLHAQCSFSVSTTASNVTCYNGTNGSISVAVTGGTAPYQYQLAEAGAGAWQSLNSFTGLAANTYPVSVKDASGCITTVYATVKQPAQLAVTYTAVQPTCSGSANGSIATSVTGGTAPYTYSWSKDGVAGFGTQASPTGLGPGNYYLVVTDTKGCTASPVIAQEIKPVTLSGFNADVVAEGTLKSPTTVATSAIDEGGAVFYASGFSNASGATGTQGLPTGGSFASAQNAARSYQLAGYSGSNALLLASASSVASYGGATTGTLTFASQHQSPYSQLYVVGTTGSGTGTINYTVTFTDATTATGTITLPDWYLGAGTASTIRALGSLGRVSYTSPYAVDNTTNFNLFEAPIAISGVNQAKSVKSILFSWAGTGTARTAIFAVTGYTATGNGVRINDGAASSVTPAVSIASSAPSNQFCSGQSVTFTAAPAYGGTAPSYAWKVNGTTVQTGASPTYTTSSLTSGSTVQAVMTAAGGVSCLTTPTATSNTLTLTQTALAASASVSASATSICSGTTVTFTATPTNGGASPAYQWQVNGVDVSGATGPSYSSSTLVNGDQMRVRMISSIGCATGSPATSAAVTVGVQANLTPTAAVTSARSGTSLLLSAAAANTGTGAAYQWYRNGGALSGATASSYTVTSPTLNDQYSVKVTPGVGCYTAPAVMSNYLQITSAVLPVTWQSFTVRKQAGGALLQWTAATTPGSLGFTVEHSTDGSNWQPLGEVPAAGSAASAYQYLHATPASGTNHYRLLYRDAGGRSTRSDVRTLVSSVDEKVRVLATLILDGQLRLELTAPARVLLYSTDGRQVWEAQMGAGSHVRPLPLPSGTYLLAANGSLHKIVLQ